MIYLIVFFSRFDTIKTRCLKKDAQEARRFGPPTRRRYHVSGVMPEMRSGPMSLKLSARPAANR
jgi:hypothetical protein